MPRTRRGSKLWPRFGGWLRAKVGAINMYKQSSRMGSAVERKLTFPDDQLVRADDQRSARSRLAYRHPGAQSICRRLAPGGDFAAGAFLHGVHPCDELFPRFLWARVLPAVVPLQP